MLFIIEKPVSFVYDAMTHENRIEMLGYLQNGGLFTGEVKVDQWYDKATAGDKQHMANKLFKHGYVSPKAPKATFEIVKTGDNEQDIRQALGKLSTAFGTHQVIEAMARMYDISFPKYLQEKGYSKRHKEPKDFKIAELAAELNKRLGAK